MIRQWGRALLDFLREKPQLWQSVKENYLFYGAVVACTWVIARLTGERFLFALATFVYASFVGYAGHAIVHHYSFTDMYAACTHPILKNQVFSPILGTACRYLDFHDTTHHDLAVNRQIKNVLLEFSLNFINQGGLLILMVILCRYLNIYVIFLWAFAYCTVHNINYDYLAPVSHQLHHKDNATNYGIDIWDILFETKHPEDGLEDINHYAINLVLITAGLAVFLID